MAVRRSIAGHIAEEPCRVIHPGQMSIAPILRVVQILLIFLRNANPNHQQQSLSQQKGAFTFSIRQIAGALHASDLIRFQVIRFSIVFESPAIQNLSISAITLIGNGGLPPFVGQQNELLL